MKRNLLVFVFVFVSFVQSQPPSPSPSKETKPQQQGAARKKSGGEKRDGVPSVAVVVDGPVTQEQGKQEHGSSSSDGGILILTFFIAGATIAQAIIYFFQTKLMIKALIETRIAAKAASDSARAAADNASTAEKTLDAIKGQGTVAEKSLEVSRKSTEAAIRSADLANESVRASIIQFELTERPWLTIGVRSSGDLIYAGDTFSINCEISVKNVGKSLATKYFIDAAVYAKDRTKNTLSGARDSLMDRVRSNTQEHPYVLFPNATGYLGFSHAQKYADLDNVFMMALIVSVRYHAAFSAAPHMTTTVFHIRHGITGSFVSRENVAAQNIRFDVDTIYGTTAD